MTVSDKVREELKKITFESNENKTEFINDLEFKVKIIDHSKNPYRAITNMSLCTWSRKADKWPDLSPEARFQVCKGVLEKRALPLALESANFTFAIDDISRSCFDQVARTRYGVVFSSGGSKDNFLNQVKFVIPTRIYESDMKDEFINRIKSHVLEFKKLYKDMQDVGFPNFSARNIMPIYLAHSFIMNINFYALQAFCANRMSQTEQPDIVGLSWKIRSLIKEKFPLLAEYLRPAEDWAKRDLTVAVNGFADELGIVPHAPSGRWSVDREEFDKKYKILFDEPCTSIEVLEKYLKIKIPLRDEWIDYTWNTLPESDKKLFMED